MWIWADPDPDRQHCLEQTSIKETIDETFPNKLREILDLKEERVVKE